MTDQVKTYDPIGYDGLSALMEKCKLGMGGYVRVENYELLAKRLAQLEQQTQWISVEERLPLEKDSGVVFDSVTVLVTDGSLVKTAEYARGGAHIDAPWSDWSMYCEIPASHITHWMPLPPPPTP